MRHLLVTNDFPPKLGGIQSYLWELWRRLPPDSFAVLTAAHPEAGAFDGAQPFRVLRTDTRVLLPTPWIRRRIDRAARELDASLIVLDPALPLGLLGPRLREPYAVVLHGAEVTVPGRLPLAAPVLSRVLRRARRVVARRPPVAGVRAVTRRHGYGFPGERLRSLASRVCSATATARLGEDVGFVSLATSRSGQ